MELTCEGTVVVVEYKYGDCFLCGVRHVSTTLKMKSLSSHNPVNTYNDRLLTSLLPSLIGAVPCCEATLTFRYSSIRFIRFPLPRPFVTYLHFHPRLNPHSVPPTAQRGPNGQLSRASA